ncbi:MAG TPA: sensor histidine kinase [Bryobacteraceae bacterium]|nr:sensor histidine kinase [Bryobacteraceae bacterium]
MRSWPILSVAFCILIALLLVTGFGTLQRARRIYGEMASLHTEYQQVERILSRIRTDIHLTGNLVRDYLLDRSHLTGESTRQELRDVRAEVPREIEALRKLMGPGRAQSLDSLSEELDGYWESLEPLFGWTPDQKLALSSTFLRRVVLPRRDAVLAITREIRDLNEANLAQQRRAIEQKEDELPRFVFRTLAMTVLIGLLVAGGSVYRIMRLESRAEAERTRIETAEGELRRLSQQLVRAQEEERRAISRELHDEVGQMLTAQRMELRNLQQLCAGCDSEALVRLEETAQTSEQALRTVRDIAMGLRPSMLDDLGLAPAIEWQARDFSRRYGIPVSVQLDGELEQLPDAHRTCVYRVVQEALTNCARHAHAGEVRIAVHGRGDRLTITVQDDGVGFSPTASRSRGLGLIGIEERVKELGGTATVFSQLGKGTTIAVDIPLLVETADA